MEETGIPGIMCIICQKVLSHSSEHGTCSMGKHLLAKAHNATLNVLTELKLTELSSATVDEIAFAIQMRQ